MHRISNTHTHKRFTENLDEELWREQLGFNFIYQQLSEQGTTRNSKCTMVCRNENIHEGLKMNTVNEEIRSRAMKHECILHNPDNIANAGQQ